MQGGAVSWKHVADGSGTGEVRGPMDRGVGGPEGADLLTLNHQLTSSEIWPCDSGQDAERLTCTEATRFPDDSNSNFTNDQKVCQMELKFKSLN